MSELEIHQFIAGQDNYCVLLHDAVSGETVSIDAPDGPTIERELVRKGWKLTQIWITHHHGDHTAGNLSLKAASGCRIAGPAAESTKIPGLDRTLRAGDHVMIGMHAFAVIETPGHTLGHISLWSQALGLAFTGDTVFALGCGRVIEGDYPMMLSSLEKIAALPPETMIYCGHEYTAANARFALQIEPGNEALKARAASIAAGGPTVPSRLADELATNPFLRADAAEMRAALGMASEPAWAVFGEIRDRKNRS